MGPHAVVVVADDLTGANDTGHAFAARDYRTVVVGRTGDADAAGDAEVVVLDTDSRYAPPEEAAARVREAVADHPADLVYKKVDSTLRGNLAAEVDAAVAAAEADLAVVAPAFPGNGRVTAGGHHLVGGTPVAETEAGEDPDRPVRTSHLPSLFADSAHPVVHLPLDRVASGADAVADALREALAGTEGPVVVTCDATRSGHLDAIAGGGATVGRAVFVGSAGLAAHVRIGEDSKVIGIVGSVAPETLTQLDRVPDAAVVELDAARAVTDPDGAIEEAVATATAALDDGGRAVVTGARDRAAVDATLTTGREAGLDDGETREVVASALGRVARRIADDRDLGGLLLSGGSVAAAAMDAFDGRAVELAGRSVEAGVPVGRIAGGSADGLPVVTKAGAFGGPETILNCLDALARYDA